ncbi:MAG TPA: type II toxin-antitoxin system VapC family toxin [Thermoanaerobaculia bacterium]|jgi:predicted nucleic acid-binding protein|nr:type II toxin-antitoxin system VapC family toxin [Thermoanaerobaculia bacterium]
MSLIVLDASAAVELLLRTPAGGRAEAALRGGQVIVPGHFDAEVFSALGRLVRSGELAEGLVEPALAELARAPFARYALPPFLATVWELRHNLSLRDALYVALARRLDALFVTADARLARAPSLGVEVVCVGRIQV